MGCALAGVLPLLPLLLLPLLPLLMEAPVGHGWSCDVTPRNWTARLNATCLNFSGQDQDLHRVPKELQFSRLRHLDLSRSRLRVIPRSFFDTLETLQVLQILDVTNNPLSVLDVAPGALCALELRADCVCALVSWHRARANCSDAPSPQCQASFNHTQNLTLFLETHCPKGLGAAAIGGLAAGSCVLLALGIAGSWLACRLRGREAKGSQNTGKALAAPAAPRSSSSRQPRYSNQAWSPRPPVTQQFRPTSSDYENMFQGEPAQPRWGDRPGSPNDSDFYMEFEDQGTDAGPQAIYCNLQTLHAETTQDEDDYVIPGC